jgi:hypothetical protein
MVPVAIDGSPAGIVPIGEPPGQVRETVTPHASGTSDFIWIIVPDLHGEEDVHAGVNTTCPGTPHVELQLDHAWKACEQGPPTAWQTFGAPSVHEMRSSSAPGQ